MNYVAAVGDGDTTACRKLFSDFAKQTSDAPLYSYLAAGIADDPELAALLHQAPPAQRLPVLLFASVHWLLLEDPSNPLARHYPNLAGGDALPALDDSFAAFRSFCHDRRAAIVDILTSRRTQTNEIGRTALFVPTLGVVAAARGPLAHIDVGASAGLNLLIPHYDFVYEPGGTISVSSSVVVTCGVRGGPPVPIRHPPIAAAVGVDVNPVDVGDADQARWLEACVWPDQVERFRRLSAAIDIANRVGVDVRRGDAVTSIAPLVGEVDEAAHPVVTSSWVMNYLSADERTAFVAEADRVGATRDLTWVYVESPALCPELPGMPAPSVDDKQPTAVVAVMWRSGRREARHVADAHPHGRWMHWR